MNSLSWILAVLFSCTSTCFAFGAAPQTTLNHDPVLGSEIYCVEGAILDLAVHYEGNPSTAVYDVSNVSFDVTENSGTVELVWSMTATENNSGPGVPSGSFKFFMSCSAQTFGMDDPVEGSYGGGTWTGDPDDGSLSWTAAVDPINISGKVVVDTSTLPHVFSFSFEDKTELNVFLVADCGSANPGPVDHIPPTVPDDCGNGGGGDGEDDCDEGCDDDDGDDDDPVGNCEVSRSGLYSVPGNSSICPLQAVQSFGVREDFALTPNCELETSDCESCLGVGGAPIATALVNRPMVNIRRRLTPQELTSYSSFGLGWYSETDYAIEFFPETSNDPNTILFFDPLTEQVFEMVDDDGTGTEDGVYHHVGGASYFKSFELFSDSNFLNHATNPNAISSLHSSGGATYLYGKLTRRNGWVYKFKVMDVSPFASEKIPFGRLSSIESPQGFAKTFTYKSFTTAEVQMYPQRLLQIDAISDSGNNTAHYTYETDPRGGRYVVEKIEIDTDGSNGTADADVTLLYEYDAATDRLATVSRDANPEPVVMSSYTYGEDTAWDAMTITFDMDQLCLDHQAETVLLSNDLIVYDGELVNQFAARLLGKEDGTGYRYMTVYRGDDSVNSGDGNIYRILYRGQLIEWSVGQYSMYYESFKSGSGSGFYGFTELVVEPTYHLNLSNDPQEILLGQPDSAKDITGYETGFIYDNGLLEGPGNLTAILHYQTNGTTVDSFEKFAYNARNELVMHRDREGYATIWEYDSLGKLTEISRGLKDSNVSTDQSLTTYDPSDPSTSSIQPISNVSTKEVFDYYTGGSWPGLLKSKVTSRFEDTPKEVHKTYFEYTTDGTQRLREVTLPAPAGISIRPTILYEWTNGLISKITDETNNDIEFFYDELGRRTRTLFSDGSTEDVWYDDDNHRVFTKNRNNIVSYREWDQAGRLRVDAQAYGIDADLSDHTIDQENFDPDSRSSTTGVETITRYSYLPGKTKHYRSVSNNRSVSYTYDHRDRLVSTTQSIGPAKTDVRKTTAQYLENRIFKTTKEFQFGGQQFKRNIYRGYSSDNTTVRLIECRDESTSYLNNDAVMAEVRPSYDDSSSDLRVIDRITDMRGATVREIDERGIMTDYVVDELGRTNSVQEGLQGIAGEPLMMEVQTQFDFRGNPVSTTNRYGGMTVMTYDDAGNLATRTVADGEAYAAVYSYEYDEKSRQVKETLPSSGINQLYYSDCCGRQRGKKNAEGVGTVSLMNSGGQNVYVAGVTNTFDFENDSYSNIPSGKKLSETTRGYDDAGRLKFRTLWINKIVGPIDPTDPPIARDATKSDGVTTQYAYLNKITGNNNSATVTVDRLQTASSSDTFAIDLGDAVNSLQAEGVTLSSARPGTASITIRPDERTYTYKIKDSLGRIVMSGESFGPAATEGNLNDLIRWTATKHDESDSVSGFDVEKAITVNQDGYQLHRLFDAFGFTLCSRQIETNPARTNDSFIEYDLSGNWLKLTDANGSQTEFAYDALGRRTSKTSDSGTGNLNLATTTEYFGDTGLVKKTVDANGNEINYLASDYDVLGRLLKVRDRFDDVVSGDNLIERVFDSDGNVDMITDAEGKTTDYDYDLIGRKVLTTFPDGKQEILEYYDSGKLKTRRHLAAGETIANPNDGLVREYFYDYSGALREVEFTDNRQSTSFKHVFIHDDFLRRISAENENDKVSVSYTYTDRGQLKTEQLDYDTSSSTNPLFTTTHDYDNLGRLKSIDYPDSGNTTSYTYTDRNQLATVSWDDGVLKQIESRSYDSGSRLVQIDRDNFDETRSYDGANRLLGINNQDPAIANNSDQIGDMSYSYDSNGNKLSEGWSNGPSAMSSWDFTTVSTGSGDYLNGYDEENHLRRFVRNSAATPNEAISDAYLDRGAPGSNGTIGNIKSLTGGANATFNGSRLYSNSYELTSVGGSTQQFNLDGQLETTHSGNDLQWDAAGRLKQVDNGTEVFSYGYDCDGRRIWKKKQGETSFTLYAYSGDNCISEITITNGSTSSIDKEFVYGAKLDDLLLVDEGATQLGVVRNQQLSVMAVYNYLTGAVVGRFNYDIFGNRFVVNADGTFANDQAEDFGVEYGYTSRRHDPESGLMYFRARYFDANTGEFISQDPRKYVDGMSMYRGYFVPRNIDPRGLMLQDPTDPGSPTFPGCLLVGDCPPFPPPHDPPPGSENWPCLGPVTLHNGPTYTVARDTCCQLTIRVSIRGQRCQDPNHQDTGDDVEDANHFYTKITIKKTITASSPGCADDIPPVMNCPACNVFPGRFLSRLQQTLPENVDWPPSDGVVREDDFNEEIETEVCNEVISTAPGVS